MSLRFRNLGLTAAFLASLPALAGSDPFVKILVDRDGVYRVTDAALSTAGFSAADGEIDRLRLTLRGKNVPIHLERTTGHPRDGRFAFEFVGLFPRGTKTWEDTYTKTNIYRLDVAPAGAAPSRIAIEKAPHPRASLPVRLTSPQKIHYEVNRKLIRFTGLQVPDELWYWEEIKGTDPKPKTFTFRLDDADTSPAGRLRIALMGYSSLPETPDHTVEVIFNNLPLGKAAWDGETPYLFEAPLPSGLIRKGNNVLALRASGENTKGIDLVLLDWVELSYKETLRIGASGQKPFWADASGVTSLRADGAPIQVFDSSRPRLFVLGPGHPDSAFMPDTKKADVDGSGYLSGSGEGLFYAVKQGGAFAPERIEVSRPEDLQAGGRGAEFVIITHAAFRSAAERLAAARRKEGLTTAVVDVADVYDRFNHGFLAPEAIGDFLKFAYEKWTPRPRYALFVGDASWDYKNDFVSDDDYADWHWQMRPEWHFDISKNGSTPYRNATDKNDRQFVPTYQYQSPWGHAASDNYFAALGKPKDVPRIAVGRFTVATLAEANAVVDKVLEYEALPDHHLKIGLFVTNGEEGFVQQSELMTEDAEKQGYAVQRVYPKMVDGFRIASTKDLEDGFNSNPAYVLFVGHGGRYVWHIGAENGKAYDLFGLQHLDELKDAQGYPVVVSLTCYSAPFDHPVADSIGEKLLRMPHKGAIAVVAASWRNAPPLDLGRRMLDYLGAPGAARIGDAFVRAKSVMALDPETLATYNLLGDPTTTYRGPVPMETAKSTPPKALAPKTDSGAAAASH